MMNVSRKQFFVYTVLPQLRPRLQQLFFTGFSYIPYFIALVYQTVKLLPPGHAYLNPANIGRYGIRHVIAEAANNLEFSKRNIDQIILFGMVLVGLMIVFTQIVLLCMSLFMNSAFAGNNPMNSFPNFFRTPAPEQDIALMMLDLVFGVPNFFMSCVDQAAGAICQDSNGINITNTAGQWILAPLGWPMPIHDALHAMFRVYNIGLLVVAAFITCYFIAAVALETAQTGTPFGKRFNKLWAPLRIVVAIGLLIPLGSPGAGNAGVNGLSTSQYIVLYAAKFGSAFATNGWKVFNDTLTDTYVGQMQDLVSTPNTPEVGGILQFMFVASTCREYYASLRDPIAIEAYVVKDVLAFQPQEVFAEVSTPAQTGALTDYDDIIDFIEGGSNIVVRFGVIDDEKETATKGFVKPICGEIIIPLTDPRDPTVAPPAGSEPGAETMQRYYVYLLQELWSDVYPGLPPAGYDISTYTENYPRNMVLAHGSQAPDPNALLPNAEYRAALSKFYNEDVKSALTNPTSTGIDTVLNSTDGAVREQINSASWAINPVLLSKGWAGAGIWYNKIAELNGAVTEATMSVPTVSKWPEIMEYVRLKKRQQDQHVPVRERFKPELAGRYDLPESSTITTDAANVMWKAFDFWQEGNFATTSHTEPTGNIFIDAVNAIFGTEGLFNMRKNANIHPLAQLTGIGKSLIEASIRNLTFAGVGGGSAALFSTFDLFAGASIYAVSSFMVSIAMITMTAGFLLYYIVPFLPFIYFFFALGGWLKAIFEAMVGAPLWALAHIRIDGNGLPGAAAVNGYFLIFEIFLRPILIIFGLLASVSIFSALVAVLNQIWDLITANLTGFDVVYDTANGNQQQGVFRSAVDTFFFTVIYAIIVYMMALSSFKLIDLIPANILRWMGQSVATENDARENAAETLASHSTVGAQQAIGAMGGSLKGPLDKAAAEAAAKKKATP
jgi:conjugal transfer/type IV secretion protein DotA/TraY